MTRVAQALSRRRQPRTGCASGCKSPRVRFRAGNAYQERWYSLQAANVQLGQLPRHIAWVWANQPTIGLLQESLLHPQILYFFKQWQG